MSGSTRAGGWRADTLMDAVAGIIPIDRALHLVGIRKGPAAVEAQRALDDAVAAYKDGQHDVALATAASLAEDTRLARQPRKGAAA